MITIITIYYIYYYFKDRVNASIKTLAHNRLLMELPDERQINAFQLARPDVP